MDINYLLYKLDWIVFKWYCLTNPKSEDYKMCKKLRDIADIYSANGEIEKARRLRKRAYRIERR